MSSDDVIRKAEARRAKLLQQKELRMNKILLGSRAVGDDEIKDQKSVVKSMVVDSSTHSVPTHDCEKIVKEPTTTTTNTANTTTLSSPTAVEEEETQLTQRKTDGAHFPRKVSLISSPANFKTLQQNQAAKDGLLPLYLYSFVTSLHHHAYSLLPLFTLILFAVIGSLIQYNFLLPFLASQLVRIIHALYSNPNGLVLKFFDLVSAMITHLIIFCTFYIVLSVSRQQIHL